jgi:hypothetical protein
MNLESSAEHQAEAVDSNSGMEKQDDLSFSEGEDETKLSDGMGSTQNESSAQTTRDETWVRRTRCLVFVVLVATAATVGIETFRLASAQQEKQFEAEVCQDKRREDTVRKRQVYLHSYTHNA